MTARRAALAISASAARTIVAGIRIYRAVVSPWLRPACRYFPSCSEYAIEAVMRYGVIRGGRRALGRLLRCHPLERGGVDLVD
jgi:putative membrane protein insertion efficiency factor